jgi:hypothetical protein
VRVLSVGDWQSYPAPETTALGALILKGMVVVRMDLGGRSHPEVLGEGDVLNPA